MAEDLDPHDVDIFAPPRDASYKYLRLDTVQGIARITLNRPPANVLSIDVMQDINTALESLEYQRDVKLVVIRAAGKYFSAGFDLNDHFGDRAYIMLESFRKVFENLAKLDKPTLSVGDRAYIMLESFRKVFENLAKLDKPTLSVVAGPALGAGSLLAAGADICLAASAAAKFGHPEIKGGVFNTVAAALLPRIVGRKKAFEIVIGGAGISAAEAERIGLITRAVADDKLEAEAAVLIQRFQESSAPVM